MGQHHRDEEKSERSEGRGWWSRGVERGKSWGINRNKDKGQWRVSKDRRRDREIRGQRPRSWSQNETLTVVETLMCPCAFFYMKLLRIYAVHIHAGRILMSVTTDQGTVSCQICSTLHRLGWIYCRLLMSGIIGFTINSKPRLRTSR